MSELWISFSVMKISVVHMQIWVHLHLNKTNVHMKR